MLCNHYHKLVPVYFHISMLFCPGFSSNLFLPTFTYSSKVMTYIIFQFIQILATIIESGLLDPPLVSNPEFLIFFFFNFCFQANECFYRLFKPNSRLCLIGFMKTVGILAPISPCPAQALMWFLYHTFLSKNVFIPFVKSFLIFICWAVTFPILQWDPRFPQLPSSGPPIVSLCAPASFIPNLNLCQQYWLLCLEPGSSSFPFPLYFHYVSKACSPPPHTSFKSFLIQESPFLTVKLLPCSFFLYCKQFILIFFYSFVFLFLLLLWLGCW